MTKSKTLKSFMKAKVAEMDEAHLDPGERADLVNTFIFRALGLDGPEDVIKQPLYWDLICYCFEMLSNHAVVLEDEDFLMAMKHVNNMMYSIHYAGVVGEESFLGPEREKHKQVWVERIERVVEEEGPGREE